MFCARAYRVVLVDVQLKIDLAFGGAGYAKLQSKQAFRKRINFAEYLWSLTYTSGTE